MSVTATDPYANVGLSTQRDLQAKDNDRKELGQEDFLRLMTTQLQQQDPFKPMENGEFLSQMAQFGTVQGIEELGTSFESLSASLYSNQALQASSMIGRTAYVPGDTLVLPDGGSAPASIQVPSAASQVTVTILDENGQIVDTEELGPQAPGMVDYAWDGRSGNGTQMPPGSYYISVNGLVGGQSEALGTLVGTTVESVNLDRQTGAVSFNLAGLGAAGFQDIWQVR